MKQEKFEICEDKKYLYDLQNLHVVFKEHTKLFYECQKKARKTHLEKFPDSCVIQNSMGDFNLSEALFCIVDEINKMNINIEKKDDEIKFWKDRCKEIIDELRGISYLISNTDVE